MKNLLKLAIPLLLIAGLIASCTPSEEKSISDAVLNTMVAMNVQNSQTAIAVNAINEATGTSEAFPTFTPTVTVYATPTPGEVWLTVNKNTNCRTGSGSNYDYVTVLMEGQQVKTTARNFEGNYYYVTIPELNDAKCWVWAEYLTVNGDPTPLPIYTQLPSPTPSPTPTPLPSFQVYLDGMNTCGAKYTFRLKIVNDGGVAWSSVHLAISDRVTHDQGTFVSDNFTGYNDCDITSNNQDLAPGEEGYVTNVQGDFNSDPAGHRITVIVTLYAKDGQKGQSLSKEYNFTP